MSWITVAAIYFIVWWLCFFLVLPFGIRTQAEEDETLLGTVASAPARPRLWRKMLAASILAGLVVGGLAYLHIRHGLDMEWVVRHFGVAPSP